MEKAPRWKDLLALVLGGAISGCLLGACAAWNVEYGLDRLVEQLGMQPSGRIIAPFVQGALLGGIAGAAVGAALWGMLWLRELDRRRGC